MNSLDEFQMFETMLRKFDQEPIRSHKKQDHQIDEENLCLRMDFLKNIISSELSSVSNYEDLSHRDELVQRLCQRLYSALKNNEEIRKSEMEITRELNEMKQEMQKFSSFVHKCKNKITDTTKSDSINNNMANDSLEIFRRQILNQTFLHSQLDFDCHIEDDKKLKSNRNSEESDIKMEKMLLDQIKALEERVQSERQSYLTENDRLNRIIEEKQEMIEKLKKCKHLENKKCSNDDVNRFLGLFEDWPVEEQNVTVNDTELTLAGNFQTNNRLLHVLSDLVKTFLDTENDIQKQLELLGLENKKQATKNNEIDLMAGFPSLDDESRLQNEVVSFDLCEDGPDLTPSSMVYSNQSSSLNNGNNDIEDDVVLGASRRLRIAVERVLNILADIVDHYSKQDFKELLKQKEELALELQEEGQRSEKLTRQLLDKENILLKLEQEKKVLLSQLLDYNEIKDQHEQLKDKLQEYQRERERFLIDTKKFEKEKLSFTKGLPQHHQKLRQENESLNREIGHMQQEKNNLIKRNTNLISELENSKLEKEQMVLKKNSEFEELLSQIDSKEKNLVSLKRFIEENAQERESEREEFNKEVSNLKEKIKENEKTENKLRSNIRSFEIQLANLNEDRAIKDDLVEELTKNLKETNLKISELNLIKRDLEGEVERFHKLEGELGDKINELSATLNIKLHENANLDEIIDAISQISLKSNQFASNLNDWPKEKNGQLARSCNESEADLNESIFVIIKTMDDKIQHLNKQVNDLLIKNRQLNQELDHEKQSQIEFNALKQKFETVDLFLQKTTKTNELLQQEINASHLKYSELKMKLNSSIDTEEFKKVVNDFQAKLNDEKRQTESTAIKLEQANRHVNELTEKLDAYKKEIKSFKELMKLNEQDKFILSQDKTASTTTNETNQVEIHLLNSKLASKEKTILFLEQNVDMLKSELDKFIEEKSISLEKLGQLESLQIKLAASEKNLEKSRLQNKILNDKINYLQLEIENFKKKIELLRKENQHLVNQKNEINQLALFDHASDDQNLIDSNQSNGLFLSGLEKMNHISSNNLLMLKVRRLLTQKRALIYQKNYLVHMLGSYQRTENDTLALLANFNHSRDSEEEFGKMKGKCKFRSVAYAMIALNRMKLLVKIWQCRKRQLLFHKTASSIANLQSIPLPPKNSKDFSSSVHRSYHQNGSSQINSTLKDYVDRLHLVHDTLGLYADTKKT